MSSADYNLTIQMEKYDPAAVEADIQNLDTELADEDAANSTLTTGDVEARLTAVKKFLSDNSDRIKDQHARMQTRVTKLRDLVAINMQLEAASADYKTLVESADAQLIAQLLTEMNAMSQQYHELLLNTGRAGRPPVF